MIRLKNGRVHARLLKKYTRNKYTFSFAQKYQKQRKNGIINIENIKVRDN